MTPEPTAHQALYGYEDGHRLLVASTQLPPEDRRWLLRQTDSPDADSGEMWAELLAGYPLPSGRYAWSMTWPAPEMPRPGCVWTHVLILDPTALASSGALPLNAFRRPSGTEPDLSPYRRPVSPTSLMRQGTTGANVVQLGPASAALLWAFYEPPSRPVRMGRIHLGDRARHELLTMPWLLAWPELRQRLSVADAPLTPRGLPDGPFDLQLQSTARRRGTDEERVVEGIPATPPPRWVESLAREVVDPQGLSEFLAAFGPELPASRDSMLPLVQCWRAFEEDDPDEAAAQLIMGVSKLVAQANRPTRLVDALVNSNEAPAGCARPLDDVAVLRALITRLDPRSIERVAIDIEARTNHILRSQPQNLGRVIEAITEPPNQPAREILDTLAGSLRGKALHKWLSADARGVSRLLQLRPSLAANPEVWRTLGPTDAWEALKRIRGKKQRIDIVAAMVASGLEVDPAQVARSWKDTGPAVAERLAADSVSIDVIGPWIDTMTVAQKQGLARRSPQASELAAAVIERMDPAHVADLGLPFLSGIVSESQRPAVVAKIFLAALENGNKPTWAPLGVASYEQLYPIVADQKGRNLDSALDILAEISPDTGLDQDLGTRLAKTLNRALKNSRWPPTAALACKHEAAFEALIDGDDRAGLARRVLGAGVDELSGMTDWQRRAVFVTVTKKSDRDSLAKLVEGFESVLSAASTAWKAMRGR